MNLVNSLHVLVICVDWFSYRYRLIKEITRIFLEDIN